MNTKIKILFFCLFLSAFSFSAKGQQNSSSAELIYKYIDAYESFRKTHNMKDAVVYQGIDGFVFFQASRTDKKTGITNYIYGTTDGQVLFQTTEQMFYLPALKEGVDEKYNEWHPSVKASFASKHRILGLDGSVIFDTKSIGEKAEIVFKDLTPSMSERGYLYVKKDGGESSYALFTTDGQRLSDYIYNEFSIRYEDDYAYCMTYRVSDGVKYEGAINLKDPSDFIPCNFIAVYYKGKDKETSKPVWKVQKDEISNYELYNPDDSSERTFRDDGEKFFAQKKYEEVINYYKSTGVNKPWALFFIGKALYEMASEDWHRVIAVADHYDEPHMSILTSNREWKNKSLTVDIPLTIKRLEMARKMYSAYSQLDGAEKRFLSEINTDMVLSAKGIEDLNSKKTAYELKVAQVRRGDEEAQRIAKQRAEFWSSVIGAFANSFANALSGNTGGTISNSGGTVPSSNAGVSGNANESRSSATESSTKSAPTYRTCQICRGTGEIFTTSTVSSYGNDKKVICPECGKEHWASTVHHHRKCSNCNGTGKIEVKQ